MFSLTDTNRFFLYPHPTDMRKSFYTLSGFIHLPDMSSWEEEQSIPTAWSDLVMMVEGIYPDTCRRAKHWSPKSGSQWCKIAKLLRKSH